MPVDPRRYLTTPIDLAGGFREGMKRGYLDLGNEAASRNDYRAASSYAQRAGAPDVAKSYLGFADYEDQRTKRLDDERFTKDVIGPALAKNDPQSTRSAASEAARTGRIDMASTLYELAGKTEDTTLKREALVFSKMWSDIDAIDAAPPQQRQALYQSKLQEWAKLGYPVTEQPREWGPNVSQGLRNRALGPSEAIKMAIEERKAGAIESNAVSASRRADAAELTAQAAWERANRPDTVSPRETFQQERTLRSEFIAQDKPLLEAQRTLNTADTYAKQIDPTSGRVSGPKEQIRVNDGVLLMTVARMAQGSGVLSDQDVTLITGSGLDTIIANAQGFVTGNGQLSDRQRAVLATILGRSGKNVASARSQLRNQYTGLASNYGLNPKAVINEQEMGGASVVTMRSVNDVPPDQRNDGEKLILGNGKTGTWDKDANGGKGAFVPD